jgi:Acetyltransferase (GNAT) domain
VIRGEVVAARVGFIVEDSLYLYFSGFDPQWGDYGVMTTTLVEALKYAQQQQIKTVNFSTGSDTSKSRWGVREVQVARAVAIRRSALSQWAWSGYSYATGYATKPSVLSRLLLRLAGRNWR